ncbi:alkaline phosphatase family protein [Leekyejoonella antrihumi]|nr:alkaline phosphatase family protein [Leekyejoonella antrihumi]
MSRTPRVNAGMVLAAMLLLLAVAGCGAATTSDPDSTGPVITEVAAGMPRPSHVIVVIFENKADTQVVGNAAAPFLTTLAKKGATFRNSHGIAHPSQPNYIALLSGSTHGVRSDSCPRNLGGQPNLARQLISAGRSFAGYAESMPRSGFTGCSAERGLYQRKHNPWVDFSNVPAASNRTYAQLPHNLSALPTVSFIVPNMCHDMHNCAVSVGDAWARKNLGRLATWAQSHNSLLIVTFDEDDGTRANHIPTFLVGPMVRSGVVSQDIDHYNVLRTIEDMYRLRPLGLAAKAAPLSGWWRKAA